MTKGRGSRRNSTLAISSFQMKPNTEMDSLHNICYRSNSSTCTLLHLNDPHSTHPESHINRFMNFNVADLSVL